MKAVCWHGKHDIRGETGERQAKKQEAEKKQL